MNIALGVAKAAAAGLILAHSGHAWAQYGSMTPLPEIEGNTAPAAQTAPTAPGQVLRAAACAIASDASGGSALLATVLRSSEERRQAVIFLRAARRCGNLPRQVATSASTLRGAVAESLYEAQFTAAAAARAPTLTVAPMTRPAASDDPSVAGLGPAIALSECAAARSPETIRALLAAEPMTPGEQAAFASLNPAFVSCLPAGSQLNVDARGLRSLLAEALYRWSVVQRDGPTSPWAAAAPGPAG